MNIYIPSYGRLVNPYTYLALPSAFRRKAFIVVRKGDGVAYARAWKTQNVIEQEKPGIAAARQCIIDHANKNKVAKVLMLDDDLRFYIRGKKRDANSTTPFSLYTADVVDVASMIVDVDIMLNDYAHGAIAAREGLQHVVPGERLGDGLYKFVPNIRMLRALAYRADVLAQEKIRFDTIEVMEDFNVALHLLTRGYHAATLTEYATNQARGSNATGGCSTYRNATLQDKCARELHRRFPKFVKLVTKESKSGWDGMESRTDCVISWKKAIEAGALKAKTRKIFNTP